MLFFIEKTVEKRQNKTNEESLQRLSCFADSNCCVLHYSGLITDWRLL